MKPEFVPPAFEAEAFNCLHCRVYTRQHWYYLGGSSRVDGYGQVLSLPDGTFRVSRCEKCGAITIWREGRVVYPIGATVEPPSADLSPEIKADYNEAALIAKLSPRGAAAILRLALQKLCRLLGQPGNSINDDIKALVAAGLPTKVQQALDSVRVIGNDAVHPGVLDLTDDHDTVVRLFKLVNFICQKMITDPKEIDAMYGKLPQSKIEAIQKRDKKGN
ncbi:MAG: DUF4145 domain-containing protein [Phycisphaerae bacterium]|nr:DUF4145 domain-containing protein [Phycisphaerae bacterium]